MRVEEIRAGNANVVEVEFGIVDSVEANLMTHIVDCHAVTHGHVFVTVEIKNDSKKTDIHPLITFLSN